MSVSTIAIAFSILGLFFLVFANLNTLLSTWNKQVQLIVYLNDDISKGQSTVLENIYQSNNEIDSFIFISRDEAWKNFKNKFSKKSRFIEMLKFNPLPASHIVKFKESTDRLKNIRIIAEKLDHLEGVESMEYGEKWISRFENFMIFFRIFILAVGGIIFVGLILIISNTIKLSIYSRQDEINLMSLLGATRRFIKAPLLLEGLFQGIIGVLIALGLIKIIYRYLEYQFHGSIGSIFRGVDFQFLTDSHLWVMIIASIFVGWFGSLISINQFLRGRNNR